MLNCLVGETAFSWSFLWSLKGNMETRFNSQSNNPKNVLTKYGLRWVFWFLPSHTLHTLLWRGSHPDNPVAEKKNDSLIRALWYISTCVFGFWAPLTVILSHESAWFSILRFCIYLDSVTDLILRRGLSEQCLSVHLSHFLCTFLKRNFFVRPCFGSWNDLE